MIQSSKIVGNGEFFMSRVEIKDFAKKLFKECEWEKWLVILILGIINSEIQFFGCGLLNYKGSFILSIVITGILWFINVGGTVYMTNLVNKREVEPKMLISKFSFEIFETKYLEFLIVLLYSLLFVTPGIIKKYQFAMVNYLLADEKYDSKRSKEILDLSRMIMNGHKMDLFLLQLSFIGWHILSIFTLGILEIWILPWQKISETKFILEIKDKFENEQAELFN